MHTMAEVNNVLSATQFSELLSTESCHLVLETPPPEYVAKVSRYLASSCGHNEEDKGCGEPLDEDSRDSGDSLFITQKPLSLPVRTRRRPHKDPTPSREEDEDDSSSSKVPSAKKKPKKYRLPEYSFPFLNERKRKKTRRTMIFTQNTCLHNYTMGGFLKCVQKMWKGKHRRGDVELLPTVDRYGEDISPLTEEEDDEGSCSDDIKVVEKDLFVLPLKTKQRKQTRSNQSTKKRTKSTNTRQKASQEKGSETSQMIQESSDDEEHSCQVEAEKKMKNNKLAGGKENFVNQSKIQMTKRLLTKDETKQKTRVEGLLSKKAEKKSLREMELQTEVLHMDDNPHPAEDEISDTSTNISSYETWANKRKEDKGDHVETSSDVEVDGIPCLSQENREKSSVLKTTVELERNRKQSKDDGSLEHERGDTSNSKRKESKKSKTAAENVTNVESDLRAEERTSLVSSSAENGGKKRKIREANEEDRELNSSTVSESLNDNAEVLRKKKEEVSVVVEDENDLVAPLDVSESSFVKRKKHKKKSCFGDGEEAVDMGSLNSDVALTESTEVSRKKRKKKKFAEDMDNLYSAEEKQKDGNKHDKQKAEESLDNQTPEEEIKKKKKKKKKFAEDMDNLYSAEEKQKDGNKHDKQKVEESLDTQTPEEEIKKKKKKKMFAEDMDKINSADEKEKDENKHDKQKTEESLDNQTPEEGVKKKKKKKKKFAEDMDNLYSADEKEKDGNKDDRQKAEKGLSQNAEEEAKEKKKKKKKKKKKFAANIIDNLYSAEEKKDGNKDDRQKAVESLDNQTAEEGIKKKKKKKKLAEDMDNLYTAEEKQKDGNKDDGQKTKKSLGNQNADEEVKKKKKKKKMSEKSLAESIVSVSVQQKEVSSSFLCADAVSPSAVEASAGECGVNTGNKGTESEDISLNMDDLNNGDNKKKKKSKTKMLDIENVDEHNFQAPNTTCLVKRKHKGNKSELMTLMESLESAEDAGIFSLEEAVVAKKKKKKKGKDEDGHLMLKSPSAETISVQNHASSASESQENKSLNDIRHKKKAKLIDTEMFQVKSFIESADSGPEDDTKTKKKKENIESDEQKVPSSPSLTDTSLLWSETLSDRGIKNKRKKTMRKLYNSSDGFFSGV